MADMNSNNENIPESLGCKSCLKPFKFYLMLNKSSKKCYLPNKCPECVKNNYKVTSTAKGSLKQLDRSSDVVMENSPTFAEILYVGQGKNYELSITENDTQEDGTVLKKDKQLLSPSIEKKEENGERGAMKPDRNNNKLEEKVKTDWKTPIKQEPVSEEILSEVKTEPLNNNFPDSEKKQMEVDETFTDCTPGQSSEKFGNTPYSSTSRPTSEKQSGNEEVVSPEKSKLKPKKLQLGLPPLGQFKNCKCVDIHSKECIDKIACKQCGKIFKSSYNLNIHMRLHTGYMPYSCPICSQKFNNSGTFWKHKQSHQEEKPFSCRLCKVKFYTAIDLRKHNARQHNRKKYRGIDAFTCKECGKTFKSNCNLRIHMRIHTGDMPYTCPICSQKFNNGGTFWKHKKLHQETKPFSCNLCDAAFYIAIDLRSHKVRNHKMQKCHVCGKRFRGIMKLRKHLSEKH